MTESRPTKSRPRPTTRLGGRDALPSPTRSQLDPNDLFGEISEDNNLGCRFLAADCVPETVVVPEPGMGQSAALALTV
jgi:hypothetical protein